MFRSLFIFAGVLSLTLLAADYRALEHEKLLHLKTPSGEKTVIGDYDANNYRIEIPIEELDPALKEKAKNGENSIFNTNTENSTVESKEKEKETTVKETQIIHEREIASKPEPSRVIVEYDDTDRLVLEANRLFNKRKYFEAVAVVDELIRRKPSHVRAWIMKGSLMYVRGQKELAKTAWKQAQALEPENKEIKSILEKYR